MAPRPKPLYVRHSRALSLLYGEVEEVALGQREVFVGTAGSVIERTNAAGFRYYTHQSYDAQRKQRERYVAGPVGDRDVEAKADALRARIQEV